MPTPVFIEHDPQIVVFKPHPEGSGEPIIIEPEELEALRLVDLEDLSQEEAGIRMGISRGTVWRFLKRAREKVTLALTEGRAIRIESSK
jgi:predicted DNA-binding protein (UPF0251 family)